MRCVDILLHQQVTSVVRSTPKCEVKTVRKQRQIPVEYRFACAYIANSFLRPWIVCVAAAYVIYAILFVLKERHFIR
jgi:hypothetical protein